MTRLTERDYWNSKHRRTDASTEERGRRGRLTGLVKTVLPKRIREHMQSYPEYLLWDRLFERYLPSNQGRKVLEVGSAPGQNLVRFHQVFGYDPYGVEYTEAGAKVNRGVFVSHGLDPDNVIQADFFSEQFRQRYRGHFDVVFSGGFIEHFSNVSEVIDRHMELLAEGGHLLVEIPNLRWANSFLTFVFRKDLLDIHNRDIMDKKEFAKLFERRDLRPLHCDYYGIFSFDIFATHERSRLRGKILKLLKIFQLGLNVIFRLIFSKQGVESRFLSPYLVFIGVKQAVDGP